MRRSALACLAVAALAASCGSPATPGSATPPASSPVPSPSVTAEPAPTPTPRPTSPAVTAPTGGFTVDCGPLTTCLPVVAAAEAGLEVDRPPYSRVLVLPFETHWTPPPVASPPAPVESSPVEIDTFVNCYAVAFEWPSESEVIPVFQGWNGWTPGLPPAATRVYRFVRDAGTWTEPLPFELRAAEYSLDGGCGGLDSTPGGAEIVLQRVADDGSVVAAAARFPCGPAETTAAFGETLRLDAGRYQLAVEGATGSLEVHLVPVTAE